MNRSIALTLSCLLLAACAASADNSTTGSKKDGGVDTGTGTVPTDDVGGGSADTGTGGGTKDTGTGGGTKDTGTGGGTKDTGGGGTGDDSCGASATNLDCQSCCATNHDAAYQAFVDALLGCACKSGVCLTQCKTTACAATPATPTAACDTCLGDSQAGACKSAIDTACGPGGPCEPFDTCATTQCAALP